MSENAETVENKLTLSLADIELAVRLIDHAASEGAYKGMAVMSTAVGCRQRIGAFLAAALPKKEEAAEDLDDVEVAGDEVPTEG